MRHPFRKLLLAAAVEAVVTGPLTQAQEIYSNNFNGPPGSQYLEWSSSSINYVSATAPPKSGRLPSPMVTNCASPSGAQRFLGEFGGPSIAKRGDPNYMRVRVEQTISLTLTNLPPHQSLKLSFDLYILKSWDGNSPAYGPDRWRLSVSQGPVLLDASFSNNPKVNTDGSYQDYPKPGSLPQIGAASKNTLVYNSFFGDSIYRLEFAFAHSQKAVTINFTSSLFEGKGTEDESWGLDNVELSTASLPAGK
jgi:hypothetical protein